MKSRTAELSLFLVALIWGSGFVAAHFALELGVPPFSITTLRFGIAALLFLLIQRGRLKGLSKALFPGFVLGLFLSLAFIFQTVGLVYTTPSKNAFLTAVNVVITPFLYFIFTRRKIRGQTLLGAFLAIIGVGMITLENHLSFNLGDGLTLICALFFALHIYFIGYFVKEKGEDPIKLVFLQLLFAAVIALFPALLFEEFTIKADYRGMGAVLYLALFSTMCAFFLQNRAQRVVSQAKTAVILSTEAFFGTLLSILFVGEVLTKGVIVGFVVMFAAILITEVEFTPKIRGKGRG